MKGKQYIIFTALFVTLTVQMVFAQKDELGNQQYIIVKDYKPVLAESFKISELPVQDTSSLMPPVFEYKLPTHKLNTVYETAVIKPVSIKDETIQKLGRSLLRLGIGNYSTYNGELFVSSLRSKDFSGGLYLKHFSGDPNLSDVGEAGFSQNQANLYGNYFLDKATLSSELLFNRDVLHYYGFQSSDTIVDPDDYKQRFNFFSFKLGIEKRDLSKSGLKYAAFVNYTTLNDLFEAQENDLMINGYVAKRISDNLWNVNISLDYFKKTETEFIVVNKYHNLDRNIVKLEPSMLIDKEKFKLLLGVNLAVEKNINTSLHAYPNIELQLPLAENILTAFTSVTGGLIKNSYTTASQENPFISTHVIPVPGTSENLKLKAGLNGNVDKRITVGAFISYAKLNDMLFFVNDTNYDFPASFDIVYDDVSLTNLHAEVSYKASDKLNCSFHFDYYIYNPKTLLKAWQKPNNSTALNVRYNLRDKILATFDVFVRGPYYARDVIDGFDYAVKVKGFADINLGLEYRYSKMLSVYAKLNNLGFSQYYLWNQYPGERFNGLIGLTVSF